MRKTDARKLNMAELGERRRQIIRLHLKRMGPMAISRLADVSWPTVRRTIDLYLAGGWRRIEPAKRGSKPGEGRKLSLDQERLVRRLICEKRPEQLKLDFALWTRGAVGELIARECGITMGVRTVGDYLKRWGFTPQKPIKRAYERNDKAIKQWLKQTYPLIEQRRSKEGGVIHWMDETAIVNTDVRGRGYAKRGHTPVTYAPGTRQKLSMISTVTNRGEASWEIIDGNFNVVRLIAFLMALIKGRRKKIFIIMDNLRAHHSKLVKQWFADHADRIEVFYLPSYAPELNPDERLNADLKQALRKRVPVRTKANLFRVSTEFMIALKQNPMRIRSFFQDPFVKYAA